VACTKAIDINTKQVHMGPLTCHNACFLTC